MQCPRCGWTIPDGAASCDSCGQPLQQAGQPEAAHRPEPPTGPVADFMTWSALITVLALPLCNLATLVMGIIAIVKSGSARRRSEAGDRVGAMADANVAKILDIVGAALLVLGLLFAIPFWLGFLYSFRASSMPGHF